MINIPENNAEITPEKFELLVHSYLQEVGKDLKNFEAVHNVKMYAHDGTYQIDIKVIFEALGTDIVVLVECKRHKSPIKRDVVQTLHDKIRSLGAHKGIIFSTSNFQEGAIDYALEHGIATIQIVEGRLTYQTKAATEQKFEPPAWAQIPEYVGEYQYGRSSFYFLQPGYMEKLGQFLFDSKQLNSD